MYWFLVTQSCLCLQICTDTHLTIIKFFKLQKQDNNWVR